MSGELQASPGKSPERGKLPQHEKRSEQEKHSERGKLPERELVLRNREGRRLSLVLREYRQGDEPGIIACIRDEYGDTYFKRSFYQPEWIRKEAESGHITFLVAETAAGGAPGEIAGMLILKEFYPEESMCEIASQIFRKKYRGYGLAAPFFEYGLEILRFRHYSAAYCLPVLFHDTTQRLLYRLGLRATGFVFQVFDMAGITHSYRRDRNRKHSQGVQIMALEKRDAGTLYLPPERWKLCREIYDVLGVTYRMGEASGENRETRPAEEAAPRRNAAAESLKGEISEENRETRPAEEAVPRRNAAAGAAAEADSCENRKIGSAAWSMPALSEVTWSQDDVQGSLEIRVHRVGADLRERMESLHREYPPTGRQTANVFLNVNDCHAVRAYRLLEGMGYVFAGLKPLCSHREYMVLHNPGEVEIYLEDYVLSEEFRALAGKIEEGWKGR